MLLPIVDVEYYANKKNNPSNVEDAWSAYLKRYFDANPIWIRNVLTRPKTDEEWTFWQYTNRGRLSGFIGDEKFIDLNVFCGDKNEWESWLKRGAGQ